MKAKTSNKQVAATQDSFSIACFDIETSNLSADFGVVLCAVVKPYGGKAKVYRADDYPSFKAGRKYDDAALVQDIIRELNQHDILVAHNGVNFDRPFLNTRAIQQAASKGVDILDPRGKIIDPVKLCRKYLRFSYNSLDRVLQHLGLGSKKAVRGDQWLRALLSVGTEQRRAMNHVVVHCVQDVVLLERAVGRLRKFVTKINEWGA